MRKIYLLSAAVVLTQISYAQNETDALRYSNVGFVGTARYMGMAGSFGALGGDLSCLAVNPAGLSRYSRPEMNFSLVYEDISSTSNFKGNNINNGKGNFNFGNIGMAAMSKLEGPDWRSVHFGMAYNRTNFFHNRISMEAIHDNSLADIFRTEANGIAPADLESAYPFSASLAYQGYLIDPDDTVSNTYTDRIPQGALVNQKRDILRTGFMGETDISFSGNYRDKLYIGVTLGFPGVRYHEEYAHTEEVQDTSLSLSDFTYSQNLTTRGIGFNAKFGMIFLPADWVRIGLALHTPSGISLGDTWNNNLETNFRDGTGYDIQSVQGVYNYRVRTPGRVIGSLGFIILKQAAINADVEYVDYSRASLRKDWGDLGASDFNDQNRAIQENYQSAVNLRIGAEVRLQPFYLRAGIALNQSPYKNGVVQNNDAQQIIAFGLGYRGKAFYCDLGANLIRTSEDFYPYDPVLYNNQPAVITTNITRVGITAGYRF